MARTALCLWASIVGLGAIAAGQEQILLDRFVARVGGVAITETDVRAAVSLGLVDVPPGGDPVADGTRALIDRQLVLLEVDRFRPPPPDEALIVENVAAMKARAGSGLEALMQSTGLDEDRLRAIARDTLLIQTYINQRFGTTAQASLQEAREYYETHPAEFTRDGKLSPFDQVETAARTAASNERRRATIAQWIVDLRARGDITSFLQSPRATPRAN